MSLFLRLIGRERVRVRPGAEPVRPKRAERLYLRAVKAWSARLRREIVAKIRREGQTALADLIEYPVARGTVARKDSSSFETISAHYEETDAVIGQVGAYVGTAVEQSSKKVLGIPNVDLSSGHTIDGWTKHNISLIAKLSEETRRRVSDALGATQGQRVEDIADRLQKEFGWSDARARLIARDQTLKLNSQLTRDSHRAAGIDRYTWSTSQDESVRGFHARLEGKVFSYDNPPVTDKYGNCNNPGEDYQCRCIAVPVLDELTPGVQTTAPEDLPPVAGLQPTPKPYKQPSFLTPPAAPVAKPVKAAKPKVEKAKPAPKKTAAPTELLRIPAAPEPTFYAFGPEEHLQQIDQSIRYRVDGAKTYPEEIVRRTRDVLGDTWDTQSINRLLGVTKKPSMVSEVDVKIRGKTISIEAVLQGGASETDVGALERTYRRLPTGELEVTHDLFVLPTDARQGGLGSKILVDQVAQYKRLGVSKIRTHAAWDGQYVWPNMGYTLENPEDLVELRAEFKAWMAQNGPRVSAARESATMLAGEVDDVASTWRAGAGTKAAAKLGASVDAVSTIQELARFGTKVNPDLGKDFLRWRGWRGKSGLIDLVVDMQNPEQMAKVEHTLAKKIQPRPAK